MFTFPNKERRFAWIRNAVARRSIKVHSGDSQALPSESSTAIYIRNGHETGGDSDTRRQSMNSQISAFSINSPESLRPVDTDANANNGSRSESAVQTNACLRMSEVVLNPNRMLDPARHTASSIPLYERSSNSTAINSQIRDLPSQSHGGETDDVEGQVPTNMNSTNCGSTSIQDNQSSYLPSITFQLYYSIMYRLGASVYNDNDVEANQHGFICWMMTFLQKVLFGLIATMSAFQSLGLSKRNFLQFVSGNGQSRYNAFVEMSFHLSYFFAKSYGSLLLALKLEKTNAVFDNMKKYEKSNDSNRSGWSVADSSWKRHLATLLALTTVAVAGLRAFLATKADSIEYLILQSSAELGEDLFVWDINQMNTSTLKVEAEYGTNLTATTITMGSVVILRDACSYLQMGMLFDLVLLAGVALHHYVTGFIAEVQQLSKYAEQDNSVSCRTLQQDKEMLWEKYQILKQVNDAVNDLFDPLLKLINMSNLMMYSFFMILLIFRTATPASLTLYVVNMVKAEVVYFIAGKIAEQNDKIEEWISGWALRSGKIRVGDVELDAHIVLRQMTKHAIGLGRGKFLMHQTFHYKFLGLVLSVFFSMADEERNN